MLIINKFRHPAINSVVLYVIILLLLSKGKNIGFNVGFYGYIKYKCNLKFK